MATKNTTDDQITPGERRELRSVVKSQIKVLRAEVGQREAELESEVERRISDRFRAEDERADEFNRKLREIVARANADIKDAMDEVEEHSTGGQWRGGGILSVPRLHHSNEDRRQLREEMRAAIRAQVRQAMLDLDRQEADLLRDLAVDALETSAARAFLDKIPSVAELVPSRRLREIESRFEEQHSSEQP